MGNVDFGKIEYALFLMRIQEKLVWELTGVERVAPGLDVIDKVADLSNEHLDWIILSSTSYIKALGFEMDLTLEDYKALSRVELAVYETRLLSTCRDEAVDHWYSKYRTTS